MPNINFYERNATKRGPSDYTIPQSVGFGENPFSCPVLKARRSGDGPCSVHGPAQPQTIQPHSTNANVFSTDKQVDDEMQSNSTTPDYQTSVSATMPGSKSDKCFYCSDSVAQCHYCHQAPSMENVRNVGIVSDSLDMDASMDDMDTSSQKPQPAQTTQNRSQVVENSFLMSKCVQYDTMLRRNYQCYY